MKIFANGLQKSGTNALAKALVLLGFDCEVVHVPFAEPWPEPVVCIVRHPRNVLCSYVRARQRLPGVAALTRALGEFYGVPFRGACEQYLPWLASGVPVVRYEALVASPQSATFPAHSSACRAAR